LVEYLGYGASLAFVAARVACEDRPLIVVDRRQEFYPASWGIESPRAVLVWPASDADALWACDQALRCVGVGAVVMQCGRLDHRNFRRLQLAAETGGTLGLLVRSSKFRGQPSWADVQWLMEPQPARERWRLQVDLVRCRGGAGRVILELDEDDTWREVGHESALHSPAELADSTAARCRSRA
jgi:hypothetical protein